MSAVGGAYDGGRRRMSGLVAGLGDQATNVMVPACPAWTVRDLVAHVAGICADILAGNMAGAGTDPWTEVQVAARRDRSIDEVVAEWEETGSQVAGLVDDGAAQLVFDLATHEHDLRGALRRSGARDSDAVHIGLGWLAPAVATAMAEQGSPLRLEAGGRSWGDEDAPRLRAEPFELLRSLSGRRSEAQLRSLDWSADPTPWIALVGGYGPFTLPAEDLTD